MSNFVFFKGVPPPQISLKIRQKYRTKLNPEALQDLETNLQGKKV
jgi:hypothetical protein